MAVHYSTLITSGAHLLKNVLHLARFVSLHCIVHEVGKQTDTQNTETHNEEENMLQKFFEIHLAGWVFAPRKG